MHMYKHVLTSWIKAPLKACSHYEVIRIGNKLIRIVCVHTECALTAIHIEWAFSQSTSIGGLKPL